MANNQEPETETLESLQEKLKTAIEHEHCGKYNLAEPLFQHCLDNFKSLVGDRHVDTLRTIFNIGVMHFNRHKYSEAEPLLNECFQLQKEVLGLSNAETLLTMFYVAKTYDYLNRYNEAHEIYTECYKLQKELYGEEDINSLITQSAIEQLSKIITKYNHYHNILKSIKDSSDNNKHKLFCLEGHELILADITDNPDDFYIRGYRCDHCNRSDGGNVRWHCQECGHDICFVCLPAADT